MQYKMVTMNTTINKNNHKQKTVKFWGDYQCSFFTFSFVLSCAGYCQQTNAKVFKKLKKELSVHFSFELGR